MKLKNKYSKQNIYNNQKFEDQIWYNQQIIAFLNFSQLRESVFRPNFSGKHFPENQAKFSFHWKMFSVYQLSSWQTNIWKFGKWFPGNHFSKNKHSQKGKHFPGTQAKFSFNWKVFFVDQKVFSFDGKVFSVDRKMFSVDYLS